MTRVALLWHMHQPYYEDLATGEHVLPWVRLHALKDYYGMVALLDEFPSVRVTFNLVPSLLVQIEAFAEGRAHDRLLDVGLKPAAELTPDERAFLVANAFHAQRARMIDPVPRYRSLLAKRDAAADRATAWRQFSEAELRDLQVWHKLAWVDPLFGERDPRVVALVGKGQGFTEDDKAALAAVELDVIRRVVPAYRAAQERGQIELSASPFYHPILPLLCDSDIHLRMHPQARMPRQRFRRPEDAREQITRARDYFARTFGRAPDGLWPPEGSVSEAIVPIVAESGFRWMASDEVLLARTLTTVLTRDGFGHLEQPDVLYRPYRVRAGGRAVTMLFRDHALSDLIGFTYSTWPAEAAAHDFVSRLAEAGRRFAARTGGGDAVVSIVLDGENAWEHFEGGGRPFLRALYRGLAEHPELQTVTMGEACAPEARPLPGLAPGSWINGDFYIWIGHPDDHRAWGQLAEARQALDAPGPGAGPAAIERAREEILIAEGSDWFWWYGDDHSSSHDLEFDDLFRRHLRNAYRTLDKPVPEELFLTNITTEPPRLVVEPPSAFLRITLDGRVTSYFEWVGAGELDIGVVGGAMHQVARPMGVVTRLLFGFDVERLYLRLDVRRRAADLLADRGEFRLTFLVPEGVRVRVRPGPGNAGTSAVFERKGPDGWREEAVPGLEAAAGEVLELAIPFGTLGVTAGTVLSLAASFHVDGHEVERHPTHLALDVTVPARDFSAEFWSV